MKTRISMTLLLAVAFFLFAVVSAQGLVYTFDDITNNNLGDSDIGEAQLWVDVTDAGSNQALFTFGNDGPFASSICDVYFDDDNLLGTMSLIDADDGVGGHPCVDFTQWADPSDLPGANNASPTFVTTTGFSADSDSPIPQNGVNPGETLGILFDLQPGHTWDNVIADLASGDLRIGLHVQGFCSGGSKGFVNNSAPVPEPATIALFGTGLIGLAGFGRKKFFKLNY